MVAPSEALQSRMQFVPKPVRSPGKCIVCGAVDKRVVDLGIEIQWYGRVYFCEDCGAQIGTTCGMISKVKYSSLSLEHEALTSNIDGAAEEVVRAINELKFDFNARLSSIRDRINTSSSSADEGDSNSTGIEQESSDTTPAIPKSIGLEGSLGFPTDPSSIFQLG